MMEQIASTQVKAARRSARLLNDLLGGKNAVIVAHCHSPNGKRVVVHGRRPLPRLVFSPEIGDGGCVIYATLPMPDVPDFSIERIYINPRQQSVELVSPTKDSFTIALADEYIPYMLKLEMREVCGAWWDYWESVVSAREEANEPTQ